jgi:hypothetical protein
MTRHDRTCEYERVTSVFAVVPRRYNDAESKEEAQEESGWKLVHGDVFRAPPRAGLLAVYVGTGVQVRHLPVAGLDVPCVVPCVVPHVAQPWP